jgi:ribulose-5-phosphate 4-epimerase/fuculose-1-phosphate aldolase
MSTSEIKEISVKIVKASRELHDHGLVRGNSGNISARIPGTDTFSARAKTFWSTHGNLGA